MHKTLSLTVALSVLSLSNALADCEVEYTTYYRSDNTIGASVRAKNRSNCTGNVVIEGTVTLNGKTYTVDKIVNGAFRESGLKSISLPDSITTIEAYAFMDSGLEMSDIKLPSNLTTIGQYAFQGTTLTGKLVIPENVNRIEDYAFLDVSGITDITLTNTGSTNLGSKIFQNAGSGKVTINGDITGSSGFQYSNITELEVADGVTTLGSQTFYYDSSLTTVIIPDSLNITTGMWYDGPYQRSGKTFYMSEAKKEQCRDNPFSCGFGWLAANGLSFDSLNISIIPDYTYDSESNLYKVGNLYYQSLSDIIHEKPYSPTRKVADGYGHYAVYDKTTGKYLGMVDENGNPWRRRIYTIQEAERASKPTGNTVKIRYK